MVKIPFGSKHLQIVKSFSTSAATFGASAGLGLLYLTDWKLVLQYVPFYGGKFTKDE